MTALNFPDSPTNGEVYEGYIYDSSDNVWNRLPEAPGINLENLGNVSGTPTAGQKLVFDGTNWVNLTGYVYVDTVYFTSNGTFSKGDYPWLSAIRVSVVGAGGGGGGSDINNRGGGGGGGGAFTQKFLDNVTALDASISVTVGAAGTASGVVNGTAGGSSSFGSLLEAGGGAGGANPGASSSIAAGGTIVAAGDISLAGAEGGASFGSQNEGGNSFWGFGGKYLQNARVTSTGADAGRIGFGYGAGGSGGFRGNANGSGANGLPGIVIVELFA
jgi:hypothetical protein